MTASILSRIYLSLLLGYITYFYSEITFWANPKYLSALPETVFYYSIVSYLYLWMVSHYGIHNKWGVYLAGSVFGWLVEGVLVTVIYGELPLSISWTAMAWHAQFTILIGVYSAEFILRSNLFQRISWSTSIGLFLGFWATFWWNAEDETFVLVPFDYFLLMMEVSLPLILAYYLFSKVDRSSFVPSKVETIVVLGLLSAYFLLLTLVLLGLPLILAGLIFVVIFVLRKSSQVSYYSQLQKKPEVPVSRYIPLILIPLSASLYYWLAYTLSVNLEVNVIVAVPAILSSIILFLLAIVKLWK